MENKIYDIVATNITQHGYCDNKKTVERILEKLSPLEIRALFYCIRRTSEKCGHEAFDTEQIFNIDENCF